jgi:hypothetical protein
LVEAERWGKWLGWRDVLFQDICFDAGFVDIQHELWGVHKFFFSMGQKKISASIDAAARASRPEVSERAAARVGWMCRD